MPCRSYEDDYPQAQTAKIETKLKQAEEMLCSVCRVLEEQNFDFDKNPQLSKWWHKHKEEDEKREKEKQRKALRKKLAKELLKKPVGELTKEDRQLLREEGLL